MEQVCSCYAPSPLDPWRGTGRVAKAMGLEVPGFLSVKGSKDNLLSISRKMETAYPVKMSATQTWVQCPYCNKTHIHGNAGKKNIFGDSRASHCMKGEYKIFNCDESDDDDAEDTYMKATIRSNIKMIKK